MRSHLSQKRARLILAAAISSAALPAMAESISFQQGTPNALYPSGYTLTGDNQILGYGGFQTANVGNRNSVQLGTGDPPSPRRVILRFDGLSTLAGAYSSIDSAQIVWRKANAEDFRYSRVNTDMFPISDANANWIEGTSVFTTAKPGESAWDFRASPNAWVGSPGLSTLGVDTAATPMDTVEMSAEDPVNATYSFDLSPTLVNQWITGINAGVMFKFVDETIPNAVELYSSEFGTIADAPVRPKLVINYTAAISQSVWNNVNGGSWSVPGNWVGGVPNASGAVAVFGDIITAPQTVTLDSPHTVGQVRFDNANRYTLAGSLLTLNSTAASVGIEVVSGSHTISAPVSLVKNAIITVTPSGSTLTMSGSTSSPGVTITKAGAGRLEMKNVRAAGLAIEAGAVKILPDGTNAGVSSVQSLSIAGTTDAWNGKLDLDNNSAVINYTGQSPLLTVANQIKTGFNGGSWGGNGIDSAAAAATASSNHRTALGYGEASALFSNPTSFKGQNIGTASVIVAHTLSGDSNLDATVNALDFNAVASNFGTGSGNVWTEGDFNYDGFVDSLDFAAMSSNFGQALSASPLANVVPEPAILTVLLAHSGWILARRRRWC